MGKNIAIIGTVGLPANYGGFETLVENLVKYHSRESIDCNLTVYCSAKSYPNKSPKFMSAKLKYIGLKPNGYQSILYDIVSLFSAISDKNNTILLLGVSGGVALPFIRYFYPVKIITNIDGIEWRRAKWQGLAKLFLRLSEKLAIMNSNEIVSDNAGIAEYVSKTYSKNSQVIAYGGDHSLIGSAGNIDELKLPINYALSVCRIEPENNIHVILETYSQLSSKSLVIVGNWNNSKYGRLLRKQFEDYKNIFMLDAIYDVGKLKSIRESAAIYLHGHSAGGTNPSLVEAMHFEKVILAFDCVYNKSTTENKALYFSDINSLRSLIVKLDNKITSNIGRDMKEIALRRYTWNVVASQYFSLF